LGQYYPVEIKDRWYEVADPDHIGKRVLLCNDKPTVLFILAKRIDNNYIFEKVPQQSDYASLWNVSMEVNEDTIQVVDSKKHYLKKWLKEKSTIEYRMHVKMHILPTLIKFLAPLNYNSWLSRQSFNNHEMFKKKRE